jgi:tripartite ATP-independent transporter DctM subunit
MEGGKQRNFLFNAGNALEQWAAIGSLALLALLPLLDAVMRGFSLAFSFSKSLQNHVFLVLGLFAAMVTTRSREHISIAVVQYIKNERLKTGLKVCTSALSAFIATVLACDSVSYIVYSTMGSRVGPIPELVFTIVMPIAYLTMAVRFALDIPGRVKYALAPAALLAGCVCALPAIAKVLWGFEPPEPFFSWVNALYDSAVILKVPVVLLLIVAALGGAPIFAAIAGIAMVLLQSLGGEPEAAPIQIFSALTDSDLVAIPLFTLTGFFLSESKAGERLVHFFRSFFSIIPGGMIIATVVICAFFTSFTGASGVTILALGGILYTILTDKSKYPENFTIGLLTSAGGVGLLFPPSLPIILVGSTTGSMLHYMGITVEANILDYFAGALIPGLILVAAMIIFGIISSIKIKIPVEKFGMKAALASLRGAGLEILLPFVLISLYFSGILSLVEISALSVLYVFVVEVLVRRDIALQDVGKVFLKAIPIIGGVLSIVAMAKALSYAIIDTEAPQHFTAWMQATVHSKYLFLLILNLALFVVGCLMDIFSAILVVLPLIVPLGLAYEIDPVHLGIIFIINLEVGFLTPPVGMNLFLASYRFQKPFLTVCRYVLPFLLIQMAVVFLVTYIPGLSTFLTKLL